MRHLTPWQIALAGITGLLALSAGYATLLSSERQQTLIEAVRYNYVFDAAQSAGELARLEAQVGRFAAAPDEDLAADVQLRYEVMLGRVKLLHEAGVHNLIARRMEALGDLTRLTGAIESIAPLVETIGRPGSAKQILDVLAGADASTMRLVSIANDVNSVEVENGRQQLRSVYRKGVWLTLALVLCGLFLVVMLIRGNKRVHRMAHLDPLTSLPNRLVFKAQLAAMAAGAASDHRLTVMLLDVDMFKHVNDTFGHAGGDALLQALASRLPGALQSAALIARLGGDEFAVLLSLRNPRFEAAAIAERICRIGSEPFDLDGRTVTSSVSIGIVTASSGPSDPQTLFKNADMALYAAKEAGRATYRFFEPVMEEEIRARREMEADLRAAILNNELDLAFQPIIDMATQRIVSCEALARWNHPRHGRIPPTQFIPLAEDTGLVEALGEWVLARACATAMTWPSDIRVSVNLSPHQFGRASLASRVRALVLASGLQPSRLELEITESVLLRNTDDVLRILSALKEFGARIALDDFGIGYSSLGYLQRFPIDKIKIDQSFVREITCNPESALIVESIGTLANRLGLITTAEGIETKAHADMIGAMGYVEGQGYFFATPLSAADCLARLEMQVGRPDAPEVQRSGPGLAFEEKRRISQDRNSATASLSRSSGEVVR